MINALQARVIKRLRGRAGLTQEELGEALGTSRYTVRRVEAGTAQLSLEQEAILLELARCSRDECGELLCQELSGLLDKPVGIDGGHGAYQPSTALATAFALLREHESGIPAAMRRALHNRIGTTQLLGLAFERNNADLVELIEDCRGQLLEEKRRQAMRRPRGSA